LYINLSIRNGWAACEKFERKTVSSAGWIRARAIRHTVCPAENQSDSYQIARFRSVIVKKIVYYATKKLFLIASLTAGQKIKVKYENGEQ